MINSKRITRTALLITIAVLLGYVESLFPPIIPVAGIKLGLANAVLLLVLYLDSAKNAWTVSILKIILCSVLFGTATSFVYSLCGGALSLVVMMLAKRMKIFSVPGVSSIGGIFHNLGQLVCAYFFVGKGAILYIPVLCVSGAVCGALIGIAVQLILKRGGNLFGKE